MWDAITNPDRLADWWLPFDADITVDLREGGEMVFAGTPRRRARVTMTCTILRVEPPMLFEHTHFVAGVTVRWELASAARRGLRAPVRASTSPTSTTPIDGCYIVGTAHLARRVSRRPRRPPAPWDWDAFAAHRAHYADLGLAARGRA